MMRARKYNKNGFDIIANLKCIDDQTIADILYKPYGETDYIEIGTIYENDTAPCGTTRSTASWTHEKCGSTMWKQRWHDAAIKLYSEWRKQ